MLRWLGGVIFAFFPVLALAVRQHSGLGMVAQNMLEPVGLMSDFVHASCFLIGGSFLFASIIKYIEYRRSPLMVPLSTVIFLLIAGIILIILPFTSHFAPEGVHRYSMLELLNRV